MSVAYSEHADAGVPGVDKHHHRDVFVTTANKRAVAVILAAWPKAVEDAGFLGFPASREGASTALGGHSDRTGTLAAAIVDGEADHRHVPHEARAASWLADFRLVVVATLLAVGDRRMPHVRWDVADLRWRLGIAAEVLGRHIGDRDCLSASRRLWALADRAQLYWPPPPKRGQVIDGTTVGERGNDVEVCALCAEPAPAGRDEHGQPLLRRLTEPDGKRIVLHSNPCYYRVYRQRRRPAPLAA